MRGLARGFLPTLFAPLVSRERRCLLPISMFGTILLLWSLFPPPALWVERVYARGLYPVIASALVPLSNLFPFSLSLAVLAALAPLALLIVFFGIGRWRRRGAHRIRGSLWLVSWRVLTIGVGVYALFLGLWGANYGRLPIETLLELDTEPVTLTEVETLSRNLLAVIRENLPEERNQTRALQALRASLQREVTALGAPTPPLPRRIKELPPGSLLAIGSSGITSPFLLEAHIDSALPEAYALGVAAHELAHVAGFAGEADADLMAALAGLHADDPYARYATALRAFAQAAPRLPAETYEALYGGLPDTAQRDLTEMREAVARYYRPKLAKASQGMYDRYLTSRGVESGVADYSRVVELLVMAQREGLF